MFTRLWRPSRLGRDPLSAGLGHLELDVMEILWRDGRMNVRDVQGRLARPAAYTTVMTTLDRLFKKGFVHRQREGRAFVYRPSCTRAEIEAAVAKRLVSDLMEQGTGAARPLLSNLVDAVADQDAGLLDELEALVKAKRRAGKRGPEGAR
jgi:predicted transcriptional regulator